VAFLVLAERTYLALDIEQTGQSDGPPQVQSVRSPSPTARAALPLLARNGHAAMLALSPLSGAKRKSDFGAVRAAFDPCRTSGFATSNSKPAPINALSLT
jgi:hypothetical protein